VSGNIGVLLSDTTDEAASRQQLFQRNRELTVLNDIGRALSDTIDVDELCRRVFEQAEHILIARTFYIALWDRESNVIRFPLFVEEDLLRSESSRPFSNGLTEHLLVTGRPLMLSGNVHEEAAKLGLAPHGRPSLAWLGTPLIARGQPFGVIAVQDFDRADAYGPHDLELLTLIAAQAAAAIHSARLYAESRRAYDELTAAQERLLGAERLRSITETVGALNHEVNNPLASIAGNAQLLLKQSSLDAAARRKVEIVLDAARRIQAVTARMSSIIQATSMPYPGGTPILDVRRSVVAGDDSPPSAGEPVPGEAGTERLGSRKGGPARPDSTSKA
jgi:GAF domain-containing protein